MANWPGGGPLPRYLTLFYLMVSLGGALGGTFVALIAPRVFPSNFELPLALAACAVLGAIVVWDDENSVPGALVLRVALLVRRCGAGGLSGDARSATNKKWLPRSAISMACWT